MEHFNEIRQRLERIEAIIQKQSIHLAEMLDATQATQYLGISLSYLYKLTSLGLIPHYKPTGKLLMFRRSELEAWVFRNRSESKEDIEQKAANYLLNNKLKKDH